MREVYIYMLFTFHNSKTDKYENSECEGLILAFSNKNSVHSLMVFVKHKIHQKT